MLDYHLHTRLCKHATGTTEAYVEAALEKGITELAFTDHLPMPGRFDHAHRMEREELDIYVGWIDRLRRIYPQLKIRCGIEADYYQGHEEYTKKILAQYAFDVVIMSVHFLQHWPQGNWVFNYLFADRTAADIYSDYIQTVIRGVETGLFDIIGHIDLIKKPGDSLITIIPETVTRLLQTVKKAGMVIEINTSGFRKAAGEPFPGFDWLPLIKKHAIPVTVGSDAHEPEQVGLQFPLVYRELRQHEFRTLSSYENRRRMSYPLK